MYTFQTAELAVMSWKGHIVRSGNQERARTEALEKLDEKTVLIVNDWAMKFLAQKQRESQTDWFGKRSVSWQMSVVYRRCDGNFQWQGFIHIIQFIWRRQHQVNMCSTLLVYEPMNFFLSSLITPSNISNLPFQSIGA